MLYVCVPISQLLGDPRALPEACRFGDSDAAGGGDATETKFPGVFKLLFENFLVTCYQQPVWVSIPRARVLKDTAYRFALSTKGV